MNEEIGHIYTMKTINNKKILSTKKTDTYLVFNIEVSLPLNTMSEEVANDVANMFERYESHRKANPTSPEFEFYLTVNTDHDGTEKMCITKELKSNS